MFIYTISDILQYGLIIVVVLIFLIISVKDLIKQARCKHKYYRETMACDAICTECGKNLGFIANQRKINPRGEK